MNNLGFGPGNILAGHRANQMRLMQMGRAPSPIGASAPRPQRDMGTQLGQGLGAIGKMLGQFGEKRKAEAQAATEQKAVMGLLNEGRNQALAEHGGPTIQAASQAEAAKPMFPPQVKRLARAWAESGRANDAMGLLQSYALKERPESKPTMMRLFHPNNPEKSVDLPEGSPLLEQYTKVGWRLEPGGKAVEPKIIEGADGFNRYVDGPNAGKRVFPEVTKAPESLFDNPRWAEEALHAAAQGRASDPALLRLAVSNFTQPRLFTDPITGKVNIMRREVPPEIMQAISPMLGQGPTVQSASSAGVSMTPVDPDGPGKFSEAQSSSAGYANRMTKAGATMREMIGKGFDPASALQHGAAALPGIGNYLVSTDHQLYGQAQEDWVRAKLRKESGAVIGDEEMVREIRTYFPRPGDSPEVIAQKERSRETALNSMVGQSGQAYQSLFGGRNEPAPAATSVDFSAMSDEEVMRAAGMSEEEIGAILRSR